MLAGLLRSLVARLRPDPARGQLARAVRAYKTGDLEAAAALCLRQVRADAAGSRRDTPDAWFLLGTIRARQDRLAEAVRCLGQATQLRPGEGLFQLRLGQCLLRSASVAGEDPAAAEASLVRAVETLPDKQAVARQGALHDLTRITLERGAIDAARGWAKRAAAVAEDTAARLRELLILPSVARDTDEIGALREGFETGLQRLAEDLRAPLERPERSVGMTPFLLAYHGLNDRFAMTLLGQVCRAAYAEARPGAARSPAPRGGRRLRVGFVSTYFYSHSIARTTIGLMRHLPREDFEVWTFSIAPKADAMSGAVRAAADRYVELPQDLAAAREAIGEAGLDVLIYADLGMSPLTWFLAYWRLAPVQMTTWGHPLTTGIDTIDHFISNRALEVPGAQAHFSENLLRLEGFFMPAYERPQLPGVMADRSEFGFAADAHVYLCAQPLFKLHPSTDAAFAAILERDPRAVVVLLASDPVWVPAMRARLAAHLGPLADRVRFAPRLDHRRFLQLQQSADVLLEAFCFGSTNAAFEAFALGKAPVTLPDAFQRTRYTRACYAEMDMLDFVPQDATGYVERAVRLACEPDYRRAVEAKVRERRDVLFDRPEVAKHLGDALLELVAKARG